jgi:hypothetical protein
MRMWIRIGFQLRIEFDIFECYWIGFKMRMRMSVRIRNAKMRMQIPLGTVKQCIVNAGGEANAERLEMKT